MAASRRTFVIGVGMTKFEKPGRRENFDYPDMALEAGTKALQSAGIKYEAVEQAAVSYVYGDSTSGQRALYLLGMTGIPVYNVNNNCSSGSTSLMMAKQLIQGGLAHCTMALGFDKMERGSLSAKYMDRTNPMDKHIQMMANTFDITSSPIAAQMFGNAGREHMQKYGTKPEHFAKIAYKNHLHSVNNPYAQFQNKYTLDEIKNAPTVYEPLTKLQCCPTSDGAACAILASEEFVRKHGLEAQAVEIVGQAMATDMPSTFEANSCLKMVGYDMSQKAANEAFKQAGLTPDDVQVVELHDCFATNELLTYEALGLCPEGKGGELVDHGDNTYGGKYVVNPSGGLISKGHPLGATGLAQCAEMYWQVLGRADKRQVPGVKVALAHNIGLGGAAVVTLYKKGFPVQELMAAPTSSVPDGSDFQCAPIFKGIEETLAKDGAKYVKKVKGVFCFKVKDGPGGQSGQWIVDVKNGNGSVKFDPKGKGDVTLAMSDENLLKLMMGKLNPQQAFFQGKLKITGNMGLAMKLKEIQPPNKAKL